MCNVNRERAESRVDGVPYLELKDILNSVKFLLVPVARASLSGIEVLFSSFPSVGRQGKGTTSLRGASFKACPGPRCRNSPGRKLLKGLLCVLGTNAGGGAEAVGGQRRDEDAGASGNGLRAGSPEEGATEGDAEHGGGHF